MLTIFSFICKIWYFLEYFLWTNGLKPHAIFQRKYQQNSMSLITRFHYLMNNIVMDFVQNFIDAESFAFYCTLANFQYFPLRGLVLLQIQCEGHIHGLVIRVVLMADFVKTKDGPCRTRDPTWKLVVWMTNKTLQLHMFYFY